MRRARLTTSARPIHARPQDDLIASHAPTATRPRAPSGRSIRRGTSGRSSRGSLGGRRTERWGERRERARMKDVEQPHQARRAPRRANLALPLARRDASNGPDRRRHDQPKSDRHDHRGHVAKRMDADVAIRDPGEEHEHPGTHEEHRACSKNPEEVAHALHLRPRGYASQDRALVGRFFAFAAPAAEGVGTWY